MAKCKIPANIQKKAGKVLKDHLAGFIKARTSYGKKYKTLVVNPVWRLICKDNDWLLVSHNEYNKIIDR